MVIVVPRSTHQQRSVVATLVVASGGWHSVNGPPEGHQGPYTRYFRIGLAQQRLNIRRYRLWLFLWDIALDDMAITVNQELGEIPLDIIPIHT